MLFVLYVLWVPGRVASWLKDSHINIRSIIIIIIIIYIILKWRSNTSHMDIVTLLNILM